MAKINESSPKCFLINGIAKFRPILDYFGAEPGKLTRTYNYVAAVAEWYRYRTMACLVTSSSPVPLKTRRLGQRCTLNLSRAEMSSCCCGVVVRRGVPAQVSSTSLDHGSKLRGLLPKALV
ncbi:uncharacterized protein TNCV_2174621 [Trichonephila clavipes]|nr:uncharacterized protein TNCV_2174621 [Trichonephila clavipes]